MFFKPNRSALVGAITAAVIAVIAAAAPARAALGTDSVVISLAACAFGDGTTTVQSGVPIALHEPGYAQGTYGLSNNFLLTQQTTLTITGAVNRTYDLSGQWGTPQQLDRKLWVTRLPNTELGFTLAPGETVVATFDITFAHPLLVAYPPVGSSGDNGPYRITEDGPLSCAITAT